MGSAVRSGQAEFTAVISLPHRGSTAIPDEARPKAAGFRAITEESIKFLDPPCDSPATLRMGSPCEVVEGQIP